MPDSPHNTLNIWHLGQSVLHALQYLTLIFIGSISAASLRGFLKRIRGVSGCILHDTARCTYVRLSIWLLRPLHNVHALPQPSCPVSAHLFPAETQLFSAVTGAGSGTTLVVVMTELTGLYAISSIMLIRKQLPSRYRQVLPLTGSAC